MTLLSFDQFPQAFKYANVDAEGEHGRRKNMTDGGKAERQHQARLPSDKKFSKSAITSQWSLSEHLIFGQDYQNDLLCRENML